MATIDISGTRERERTGDQAPSSVQVAGGLASIIEGLCYVAGLLMFLVVMPAIGWQMDYWDDPSKSVPFVKAHQPFFLGGGLFFTVSALIVLPVVVALHDRLRSSSPALVGTATILGAMGTGMLLLNALVQYAEFRAFGSLSAAVAEQAQAHGSIAYDATIQAASVCLGLWILFLSWAAIGRGALPRWLGYFGVIVGAANVLVLFFPPPAQLLSIVWFVAVGVVLLRSPSVRPAGVA